MELVLDWNVVVQFFTALLALGLGSLAVPLINKLKGLLNLSGWLARLLTATVATIMAVITLIVQGSLAPQSVYTTNDFIAIMTLVLTTSQALFNSYQRAQLETENLEELNG